MNRRLSDLLNSNKTKSKLSLENTGSQGSASPSPILRRLTAKVPAESAKKFQNKASKMAATLQSRESAFGYYRMKRLSPPGISTATAKTI